MELVQITTPKTPPPLRHPAVEEFVQEITNFWTRIGAVKNCISCHKGEFPTGYGGADAKSHGCCPPSCEHLTPSGCIGKPIGCAMYSCKMFYGDSSPDDWKVWKAGKTFHYAGFTLNQWNQVCKLLMVIGKKFRGKTYKDDLPRGCFPSAYEQELKHAWTKAQLNRLKSATKLVKEFKLED